MIPKMATPATSRSPLSLWRGELRRETPSGAVIAAVLAFGDLRDEQPDGSMVIRLSAQRAAAEDLQMLLREEACGAVEVSVVWCESRLRGGAAAGPRS